MNLEIIKNKFPKAFGVMKTWAQKQIVGTLGLPSELASAIPDEALLPSLVNSRSLYDFFDMYQIHMFPMGSTTWIFRIVDPQTNHNNSENNTEYNTRKESEDAGFTVCFSILEEKLS